MNILRDLEDGKAFEQGLNNTTTARVLTRGLENPKDSTALIAEITRELYRATE